MQKTAPKLAGLSCVMALAMIAGSAYAVPSFQFTSADTATGIQGSPFSFAVTVTGAAGAVTYSATGPDGLPTGISISTGSGVLSGQTDDVGMWTLTITANDGSDHTQTFLLIIQHPNADANAPKLTSVVANPNPGVINQSISFTASASDADGDHLSYFWDFNDSSTSRLQNPTHTYTADGNYQVVCNVSDGTRSTYVRLPVHVGTVADGTLNIKHAKLNLDFNFAHNPSHSRLQMTGTCQVPLNPTSVTINCAPVTGSATGLTVTYSMTKTAVGSVGAFTAVGGDAGDRVFVSTTGVGSTTANAKLTIDLTGAQLFNPDPTPPNNSLFDVGFRNAFMKQAIDMIVTVTFNGGTPQSDTITLLYKGRKNKTGTAHF